MLPFAHFFNYRTLPFLLPVHLDAAPVIKSTSSKAKKPPKDPSIREGYPLPEFGTCKHYKHSYRWLRFPCCGKAYPCDVCHDKKEDHEMTFANRMICGHCCKEQVSIEDEKEMQTHNNFFL